MKSYIFRSEPAVFSEICGTAPLSDLVRHLRNCGIEEIYTDSENGAVLAEKLDYISAKPLLGKGWIAAYEGIITRQSPLELKRRAEFHSADYAVSLACSGEPWKHTTVLTGSDGKLQGSEKNPPPENTMTNLCFSGMVWVNDDLFIPEAPFDIPGISAFLLPGYWSAPSDRESYLITCHDILTGLVSPWSGETGVVLKSPVPENCRITGTFWLGCNCTVGENCSFENCVIMEGAVTGDRVSLKNCLVNPRSVIPSGTVIEDKYLTLLGEG